MRVGFYLDVAEPQYLRLARRAIAAVREQMPGCEVLQITTLTGPALDGVDAILRVAVAYGTYEQRRIAAQAMAPAPLLFLDVDAIVQGPVFEVWGTDFDVALPEVADPFVRYTGGVVFCRDRYFWQRWAAHPVWAAEWDTRSLLQAFTAFVDSYPGKVLRLPQAIYEATPAKRGDPRLADALIVHYRGPRKDWAE